MKVQVLQQGQTQGKKRNKANGIATFTFFFLTLSTVMCLTAETPLTDEFVVVVVALLFYVHGKHLRSCRDGQLT